jgi:hypothetical protein
VCVCVCVCVCVTICEYFSHEFKSYVKKTSFIYFLSALLCGWINWLGNDWESSMWLSTQQVNSDHIFCIQVLEEKNRKKEALQQLFIGFKETYDSVRREFGIPIKLERLIKICLNETCSRVRYANICLTCFLVRKFWNNETCYRHCFSTLLYFMLLGGFR